MSNNRGRKTRSIIVLQRVPVGAAPGWHELGPLALEIRHALMVFNFTTSMGIAVPAGQRKNDNKGDWHQTIKKGGAEARDSSTSTPALVIGACA